MYCIKPFFVTNNNLVIQANGAADIVYKEDSTIQINDYILCTIINNIIKNNKSQQYFTFKIYNILTMDQPLCQEEFYERMQCSSHKQSSIMEFASTPLSAMAALKRPLKPLHQSSSPLTIMHMKTYVDSSIYPVSKY